MTAPLKFPRALLRPPFPYYGGKRRVAPLVWQRFGDVPNYVEPFAGSLSVLLGRPEEWEPRCETVNDLDCYLSNFWRALQADPEGVARHADWPVSEADLHARHRWLVALPDFRERMRREPYFFDAQVAGWWVWGISQWIGSGWCSSPDWEGRTNAGRNNRGVNAVSSHREDTKQWAKRPSINRGKGGVHGTPATTRERSHGSQATGLERRPHLTSVMGVCGASEVHEKRPMLANPSGVNAVDDLRLKQQIPDISGCEGGWGRGVSAGARPELIQWFHALSARLRGVRVCNGDWKRILGPSVTEHIGVTAIFLDPPYAHAERDRRCYREDAEGVSAKVAEWARQNGHNPKLRIALCGYEGEHEMPPTWECVAWKANGGYGNQGGGRGRANAKRERIWFSPHCLRPEAQPELFKA